MSMAHDGQANVLDRNPCHVVFIHPSSPRKKETKKHAPRHSQLSGQTTWFHHLVHGIHVLFELDLPTAVQIQEDTVCVSHEQAPWTMAMITTAHRQGDMDYTHSYLGNGWKCLGNPTSLSTCSKNHEKSPLKLSKMLHLNFLMVLPKNFGIS